MRKSLQIVSCLAVLAIPLALAAPAYAQQPGGNPPPQGQYQGHGEFREEMEKLRAEEEQLKAEREKLQGELRQIHEKEEAIHQRREALHQKMEEAHKERMQENHHGEQNNAPSMTPPTH